MHPIAGVVNSVIEVTDVDGVIRRIDVDNVVQRIDVDRAVQRVDFNVLLSKIDWDQQLDRIDFNKILKRVDTNSIIAKSSTGVFSSFLDTLRLQVTMIDLYLRIVTRCRVWSQQHRERIYLPPAPGRHRQRDDLRPYPKGRNNKAVAVQGRYCGFLSKAIAVLMDIFTITILFAIMFQVIEWCLILFLGKSKSEASDETDKFQQEGNMWMAVLYCTFWFMYFFLSVGLAGQTIGMAIVGLKICNCNRVASPYSTVTMKQAFIRTCLLPLTLTLCPPLGVIGLVRRDGRMLHDLAADTGMIYLWNAKLAKLRQKAQREEAGGSVFSDENAYDELDEILENEDTEHGAEYASMSGQEVLLRRNESNSLYNERYDTFPTADSGNQATPTQHEHTHRGCTMV